VESVGKVKGPQMGAFRTLGVLVYSNVGKGRNDLIRWEIPLTSSSLMNVPGRCTITERVGIGSFE